LALTIRRSFSGTLRDALDNTKSSSALKSVEAMKPGGISATEFAIASILITMGILVFYVVPMSLIFGRYDILFRTLTILFLGTLMLLII
jgi:hypothetical protein